MSVKYEDYNDDDDILLSTTEHCDFEGMYHLLLLFYLQYTRTKSPLTWKFSSSKTNPIFSSNNEIKIERCRVLA